MVHAALIDGDEANNNGNRQWIASVGVDPQPAARRIYNPTRHEQSFDPAARPSATTSRSLRNAPDAYLAEPWTMPDDVQRHAGCVVGRDYPHPVVDHPAARHAALARFATRR